MADALDVGTLSGRVELDDKMSAQLAVLGKNVEELGARMDALTQEHKKAANGADELANRFEHLAERVAEYFALREMASFVENLGEGAHALEILSAQTGINTEELQVLGTATEEYGVSADRLGTAIYQLSRRIAGGDANATTAL